MYRDILTERVPPCHDNCAGINDEQDCQVCHERRWCDAHKCDDCDWSHDCPQSNVEEDIEDRPIVIHFFGISV